MLLLYEIPYLSVPTLKAEEKLTDAEVEKLPALEVTVRSNHKAVSDPQYEEMAEACKKALEETARFFNSKPGKDDERRERLATAMYSRIFPKFKDYHWHVILGKVSPEGCPLSDVLTTH